MIELIDKVGEYIETWAEDYASTLIVKNWGFVELSKKGARGNRGGQYATTEQPIPMTINGTGERLQVSLDDTKNFIFWIRIVNRPSFNPDLDDEWGIKQSRRQILPLRIVICHRVTLGEDLIHYIVNDLPKSLIIPGYDFIHLESGEIDYDHETIHDTELGKTNYEKHRFDWNIYTINLNAEFSLCYDYAPPDYITDEFGNYLYA